jgi:adenosylhomocysteine nucleosidase
MPRIAIVAALEREVKPLIGDWPCHEREHEGRKFKFLEKDDAVVVCGGIGAETARRATEAVIALYAPGIVYSVGFAGALQPTLKAGDIVIPRRIIDARDNSSVDTGEGEGVLVTIPSTAGPKQKAQLAVSYGALAADMEAAAVARGAQARGLRFAAVKAISDEVDFALPAMERFIRNGEFDTSGFVLFALLRPWLWPRLARLSSNSRRAAHALCRHLQRVIDEGMIDEPRQATPVSTTQADNLKVAPRR